MTIEIKTLEMPARTKNAVTGKRGSKYPLQDLVAGSNQAIILCGVSPKKDHSKLSSAVANYRKVGGEGKFSIRTFTEQEDGVTKTKVGIWRIA